MSLYAVTVWFDLHQLLGGDFDTRRTKAYVTTNVDNDTLIDTETGEIRLSDEAVTINSDGTGTFTTWSTLDATEGNPTSWQTSLVVDYPRTGHRDRKTRTFGPYTISHTVRTVTNKALTSNVATLTLDSAHGLRVGDSLDVYSVDATFNGSYTVTAVPTPTSLSYAKTASDVASTTATGTAVSPYVSLALLEDEQAIPPNYQTTFTASMETIRDEAEAARDATVDISGISTSDGVVEALVKGTAGAGPLTRAALAARYLNPELAQPTGGAGTAASPWTHSDGTGGVKTAATAAQTSGKLLHVKRGYYATTAGGIALLSNDRIHFEPGVVFVVSGLAANTNIFSCIGTSGTYKSELVITGSVTFDLTAQTSTSVRCFNLEYVEDFRLDAHIRAKNGSGNPVRIVNARGDWFVRRVSRKTTETAGSCVFLDGTVQGHIGYVFADGGDEALDLSNCDGLIADYVTGINCQEPLDVGGSTGCQIGKVFGRNNSQGVNFKIDPGVTNAGVAGNHIGSVVMLDMQANVSAVTASMAGTATGGLEPNNDNSVGTIYSRTSQTNTNAVKIVGRDATNPVKRFRVGHVNHIGPDASVTFSKYTEDCHVGDENSYYESTGNISPILIANSGTDALTHYRPRVRGIVKAPSRTGAGNGVVTIMKTDGQGETVFEGHILSSGAEGIVTYQSKNLRCAGVVEECAYSGWKHRVVDTADYTGDQNIAWLGVMRNIAKSDSGVSTGLRVVAESGAPTIRKVHILHGSRFYDTQGTGTTSVADFGTADMVTCYADVGRTLAGLILTATLPTTHDIRLTGRRTSLPSTDDALSEIAAINSDGRVYTRTGVVTADATLYENTYNLVSGASGARVMTLPTPKRAGQVIIVEKTDAGANTITVSGSIRGSAGSTVLSTQYETVHLRSTTSTWRPIFKGVVTA